MMRLVQKGTRGLAIGWLIPKIDDGAFCKAMPEWSIVFDEKDDLNPTSAILAQARKLAGVDTDAPIGLMGWSAGCQTVRGILLANLVKGPLAFVAVFDGTHGAMPPYDWQIDVWRDQYQAAKKGERLFIATCSQMTYTETIPVGQKGRAMATSHILERATGERLNVGAPVSGPTWHVEMFPSPSGVATKADADAAGQAHRDQINVHAPVLLARYVGAASSLPEPAPATQPSARLPSPTDAPPPRWRDPELPLRERATLFSEAELAAGVREDPEGSNDGPRIRMYFSLDFHKRSTGEHQYDSKLPWCAAAACYAHDASRIGQEPIPVHRESGIELEQDAQANGTWVPVSLIRSGKVNIERGWLCILKRGTAEWMRHVCRVQKPAAGKTFLTIGGNENNGWASTQRSITDTDILGFIKV